MRDRMMTAMQDSVDDLTEKVDQLIQDNSTLRAENRALKRRLGEQSEAMADDAAADAGLVLTDD